MKFGGTCNKMKTVTLFLILISVYSLEALDCGIHMNRNDQLKPIISKCANSNKTLEDIWDVAPMSSESDSSSSEEEPAVDGKMSFKTRRAVIFKPDSANETTEAEQSSNQSEYATENCIIQCIFENLEMTDSTGYPVHTKILEGLLKNTTNRELRDFLQDTSDDCFQQMDKEVTMDPCNYSIKLVTCLAEKGKTNCADWPIGDIPLHQ